MSKGGDIGQSKIPLTQEGALVSDMGYDADSAFTFTSNGIDPEFETLDVQPGKKVVESYMEVLGELIRKYPQWEPEGPKPPPQRSYQNDASTPPDSRLSARTGQPIPLAPRTTISPIGGYGKFPASLPPRQPTVHTRESRPFIAPDSSSRRRSMTVSTIASHSASYTSSAPISIPRQGSRPVDLSYEVATGVWPSRGNQTAQLPSQNGTAPWILASRAPHAPKNPVDAQFMAYMDNLRKKTNDSDTSTSSRSSLIGDRVQSVRSSAFSQSFSVASPPSAVVFSPTPVFKDERLMGMVRSPPF